MLHSCISWLPVNGTCSNFLIIIIGSYSSLWCIYHDPRTQASVHACFILGCLGPYLAYEVSTESEGYTGHFVAHLLTPAHRQACRHTSFLPALASISAQLGQISKVQVSMESERHVIHFGADILTQAHKLVCMHTYFLRAWAYNLATCWWNLLKLSDYDQGIIQLILVHISWSKH